MATAVGMPLGCIRCFSGMGLDLISLSGQPEYYFLVSHRLPGAGSAENS